MTSNEAQTMPDADILDGGDETCPAEAVVGNAERERRGYRLPSQIRQMASVFGVQMRLYSKGKIIYVLILLALLIPALVYGGVVESAGSTAYLLILLPMMMATIPPMLSGKILSSEFKNKTAFLTFPLPISRTAVYMGKFLASLVLSIGIFGLAYGLAVLSDPGVISFPSDLLGSFLICVAGVFAISATAYGFSTMFKRGSVGLTEIITMALPFLLIFIMMRYPEIISPEVWDYIKLLPQFSGYQALHVMDAKLLEMLMGSFGIPPSFLLTDLPLHLYIGVAAAWGILFLVMGWRKVVRKEL